MTCACAAQLQPHDPMGNVCPPVTEAVEAEEVQDEHPYADELHLGGEG